MAISWRPIWLTVVALLSMTMADSITPTNWTSADTAQRDDNNVLMQISINEKMVPLAAVLPLTEGGGKNIPPTGLSGPVFLVNPSNALNSNTSQVTFISCDTYPGEIQAPAVFDNAWQSNVKAIVLYSVYSDWCSLSGYTGSYSWIYTLKNRTDTARLLQETQDSGSHAVYATIGPSTLRSANGTFPSDAGHPNNNNGDPHTPVPPPSTAVAMVILYSITGVITALFLCIIITGALRAHRHPERYGPRNIVGRPRQSRAKGLARAMLDTLPIVKVGGQREDPKPTDVELAEHAPAAETGVTTETNSASPPSDVEITQSPPRAETSHSIEEGIAAAISAQKLSETGNPDHLGCSICTEDFQPGEDQRVLPCDHRFHPACVDPWLLNVSGTCPLCRIDLRPQAPTEDTGEVDEHGNPILHEPDSNVEPTTPAQPDQAVEGRHRLGVRRSIVEGIRGIGRPDPVAREDRLVNFPTIRSRSQTRRDSTSAGDVGEEERSRRQRLRRLFGIKTRRTGQTGEAVPDETEDAQPGPSSGSTER